jgi:hypothetical protein
MPFARIYATACLSAALLACAAPAPRKEVAPMKLRIELDPGMPLLPSPDSTPRVALGTDFHFFAGIGNKSEQNLTIEDPKGTQLISIHVRPPQNAAETSFLLNPSLVDKLGQVTAPDYEEIAVRPGAYAAFKFALFKTLMDKCLAEGSYAVSFSYGDVRSAPITLISVFAPESIEPLLAILDDTGKDMWVRKEALKWLNRVKPDFAYDFGKPDSRGFRAWWNMEKVKPGIEARFRTHP